MISASVPEACFQANLNLCLPKQTVMDAPEWGGIFFNILIFIYLFFEFKFILIRGQLLYNIVLVLPYIIMNPPWVYMCSQS